MKKSLILSSERRPQKKYKADFKKFIEYVEETTSMTIMTPMKKRRIKMQWINVALIEKKLSWINPEQCHSIFNWSFDKTQTLSTCNFIEYIFDGLERDCSMVLILCKISLLTDLILYVNLNEVNYHWSSNFNTISWSLIYSCECHSISMQISKDFGKISLALAFERLPKSLVNFPTPDTDQILLGSRENFIVFLIHRL